MKSFIEIIQRLWFVFVIIGMLIAFVAMMMLS